MITVAAAAAACNFESHSVWWIKMDCYTRWRCWRLIWDW